MALQHQAVWHNSNRVGGSVADRPHPERGGGLGLSGFAVQAPLVVDFDCVPMAGGGWHRAGPWSVDVSDGGLAGTTREDFRFVGVGLRFDDRECSRDGDAVQYVMWAAPGG